MKKSIDSAKKLSHIDSASGAAIEGIKISLIKMKAKLEEDIETVSAREGFVGKIRQEAKISILNDVIKLINSYLK